MQDLQTKLTAQPINQKDIFHNAIKISYRLEENMLVVFVMGKRSFEDSHYYWQKVIEICEENNIENVQITLALRGKYTPFDSIKNYQQMIDFVKPFDINVALIDLNGLSKKDSQIACNMASSQGMNCSYFDNELKARYWLNQFSLETA